MSKVFLSESVITHSETARYLSLKARDRRVLFNLNTTNNTSPPPSPRVPVPRKHPRLVVMSAQKIKIIARVRPKLQGELDDDGLKIVNGADSTGDSSTGGSFVAVTNPRDPTQLFKFPSVLMFPFAVIQL